MEWCGYRIGGVQVSGVWLGILRRRQTGCTRLAVVAWVFVCVAGFMGTALVAPAFACENERFRTGPSASLPDCRAYELVTPENLGRAQDMTFTDTDHVIPSSDGEHIALDSTFTSIEPNLSTSASIEGTHAVFSRTPAGWTMKSLIEPGASADRIRLDDRGLFSPDLSRVALPSETGLNQAEVAELPTTLEVGPVGGPYALVASVPFPYNNDGQSPLAGANTGTSSVPAFSDVLFSSTDHALLAPGSEYALADETAEGAPELYDWTGGGECTLATSDCKLVNVEGEGSDVKLVNRCGAELGEGEDNYGGATADAVSDDGSKIFFTTPQSGATCEEPSSLYMRVDGRETVEVSKPQGVELSERREVFYDGATPDGSEVFFSTEAVLTAGATVKPGEYNLYEYDTEAPEGQRLKFIAGGFVKTEGPSPYVVISEDGTTVYYETGPGPYNIYRYETRTGNRSFVARAGIPKILGEPSYTTPNGEFLVFAASGSDEENANLEEKEGVQGEPRGAGHQELYRYDNADGSVICVSCGEGVAPAGGEMLEPGDRASLKTRDETPPLIPMSENGQEVFFETTANLVPQDTNSTETEINIFSGTPGMDVYEWEAEGTGGCVLGQGCTHLLSTGEDVGPEYFLGASSDGSNVFFASAAQLVPQATPEFTNIYDARVDGGFPQPAPASKCLSCQGVGSPPPLFGPGPSGSFMGAGNPALPSSTTSTPRKTTVRCSKGKKRSHDKCVKTKSKKKRKPRKARKTGRGDK
jgi:hypothetical protein